MLNHQIILGIETSCDETAAAIVKKDNDRVKILSNVVATSSDLQAKYGGIIPEQAAREQLKSIIPVITEALEKASLKPNELSAIAITFGPGLIGSLLIGVETAKTLSLLWNKPLIPVNHLLGHFYANWIQVQMSDVRSQISDIPKFPCLGLLVSGGHSDLVLFKNHGNYKYLGGTRDDAAGECFDKCARMLGFAYPGGPKISQLAEGGDPKAFHLPRPMADSDDYDFSFSGLKTAFAHLLKSLDKDNKQANDLCASLQQVIIDSLVQKVLAAGKRYKVEQLIVAGGVAANKQLIAQLKAKFPGKVSAPLPFLCTDNGAMIASAGFFVGESIDPASLQANPNLSLG